MEIGIKSYLDNECWPAFPDRPGAQILAALFQLEKSQYLPSAILREKQFQQLNEVFRHCIGTVPYYMRTFKVVGLGKNTPITLEQWFKVPVLTRSMVQEHQQDLVSRDVPKSHGTLNEIQSSGSTGRPVKVVGTEVTQFYYRVFALRDHFWHQRDFSVKMGIIRFAGKGKAEYPGIASPDWGVTTGDTISSGPAVMLNSSTDLSLQVKFLLREQPDYLVSYPSNLEALARYFIREGLQLTNLRSVRSLGETVGSEVRPICRKAWNVHLVDMYTAQETGYIALQCPDNENIYHVQSENLYVEVVDDDGRPCRPGETGRVLLTTLHNFAMPLIRYEIGDYAEVGELCSCGRTLPVLKRILGRRRNMLVLPSGQRSWPATGFGKWRKDFPIKQFQFIQKDIDRIEAKLVTDRQFSPEEEKRFIDIMQESLRYPFIIEITYLENIPRSKGGKFEDFISLVA